MIIAAGNLTQRGLMLVFSAHIRTAAWCTLFALTVACTAPAAAQLGDVTGLGGSFTLRASEQVGDVGGRFTAQTPSSLRGPRGGLGPASIPSFGVRGRSAGFGYDARSVGSTFDVGFNRRPIRGGIRAGSSYFGLGTIRNASGMYTATDVRGASGFTGATSYMTPIRTPAITTSQTPLDTPLVGDATDEPASYFHAFFGLESASRGEIVKRREVEISAAKVLKAQSDARLERFRDNAREAFADATRPVGDPEQMSAPAAEDYVRVTLDLTTEQNTPAVERAILRMFAAQLALLGERRDVAVQQMLNALRLYPSLLAEYPYFGQFWGDYNEQTGRSRRYDNLLRANVGMSEANPGSMAALFLTVFCAHELGDHARVDRALDQARQLRVVQAFQEDVLRWRWAVNVARTAAEEQAAADGAPGS